MYNNQVRLILLVIFFCLVNGRESGDFEERCAPQNVTCVCRTEFDAVNHSLHVTLKRYLFKPSDPLQKKCYPFIHPYKICQRMSCELGPIEPETIGSSAMAFSSYPIEISIPAGGDHVLRPTRDAHVCHVRELKHAHIKCWKWPDFVDCLINCSVGYALRNEDGSVLSKGISCIHDDDRWWPHGFQECEPYVNCKAHLVAAGSLKCVVPVEEPPYCEISCLDYEDKEGTKPKKYVCKDENFESPLPHCARLNKDEPLLENPNKPKLDYESEEEK